MLVTFVSSILCVKPSLMPDIAAEEHKQCLIIWLWALSALPVQQASFYLLLLITLWAYLALLTSSYNTMFWKTGQWCNKTRIWDQTFIWTHINNNSSYIYFLYIIQFLYNIYFLLWFTFFFLLSYNYWNRSIMLMNTQLLEHIIKTEISKKRIRFFHFFLVQKCKNNSLKTNVIS